MAQFTMWVRNENPDKFFLLSLLKKVCRTNPESVPSDFRRLGETSDFPPNLSYRTWRNNNEGRTYVEFTLQ